MTNPIDKAALRALAEAATPGPWAVHTRAATAVQGSTGFAVATTGGYSTTTRNADDVGRELEGNAAFIAAANPATILALLDELERTERSRDMWKEQVATQAAQIEACRAEAARWEPYTPEVQARFEKTGYDEPEVWLALRSDASFPVRAYWHHLNGKFHNLDDGYSERHENITHVMPRTHPEMPMKEKTP